MVIVVKWSKYGNHDSCHVYDIDFEKLYTDYGGNTASIRGFNFIISCCCIGVTPFSRLTTAQ